MQQFTKNNNFSGFHGWIPSYNDGVQSRIMSTGGVVNTSFEVPNAYTSATRGYNCDCEKIKHANYRSANVYQSPMMWRQDKTSTPCTFSSGQQNIC